VSVKPTPVKPTVVFGLVIVKLKLVVPPTAMFAAPNDFEIVGGAITVNVAVLLVVPVPPSFEVIAPVVLFFTPAVEPVTVTLNVQLALAASEAPVSVIVSGAVVVNVPPQVTVGPDVATVSPAGSISVNPIPLSPDVVFGLVMVKLSVVVLPSGIAVTVAVPPLEFARPAVAV